MKIKNLGTQSASIGQFKDEIQSTINSKDLGLALNMVSKNLYSNPIGSFIREIVSNGVDANIQAGTNNPVKVHIYKEDGVPFIEITDNGTGMSPELFRDVYMSWFNSDKRDDNDKIGGWGLGSKSPLSYQDSFEITTIVDGIKYNYILVNELPIVNATLINEEETDEPNGTSIKIEIKNGDEYKIHEECKKQLIYFDDVYVLNELHYYNNDFKIFETKYFKFRPNVSKEMHICLGQVVYPINWSTISKNPINIAIALKFEIGELDVTLSREEINYTEETKEVIYDRIVETCQYITEVFERQQENIDFFDYFRQVNKEQNLYINIEGHKLNITDLNVEHVFKPLDCIVKSGRVNDLFSLYEFHKIENGYRRDTHRNYILTYTDNYHLLNTKFNHYTNLCIGNATVIKRKKITRSAVINIAKAIGIKLNKVGRYETPTLPMGNISKIYEVIKYIDNYLKEKLPSYEDRHDEDWVENYKREQKELQEIRKEIITHYNLRNNRLDIRFSELVDNHTYILYISKKEEKRKIVEYQSLYDSLPKRLKQHIFFFIINPTVIKKLKNKQGFYPVEKIFNIRMLKAHFRRIKVSYQKEQISNHYNSLRYSDYYMKMYRALQSYYHVNLNYYYSELPYDRYTQNYNINIYKAFQEKIDNIKLPKNRETLIYEEYIPILEAYVKKVDIFNYVNTFRNTEHGEFPIIPHKHFVKIVYALKVLKLNPNYYKF